ncbi:MAG: helix-turn-helix domain-containing protein [Candidatus Eremiobacteraeota bacterium]|nr:helix-turn-helix domain-containing protein [Candidatus Eremiobacteraeota bacterium]
MQQNERSTNRAWLGEFLRSRRARLLPKDFDFPVVKRRRTEGLLREEVAQLAGISIAYYTWIEQGREINMSADVLNAIARALRMSEPERVHLFTLVGMELPETAAGFTTLHPTVAHIFSDPASRLCALLRDPWFTVVRATALGREVFGIAPGDDLDSNILYRLFADLRQRRLWADWEIEAHMTVGMFRQALAKQPGSIEGLRLLDALCELQDFERVWQAYDVRFRAAPEEFFRDEPWTLNHARAGTLRIHRLAASIPAHVQQTLVICSSADAHTAMQFEALVEQHVDRPMVYRASA